MSALSALRFTWLRRGAATAVADVMIDSLRTPVNGPRALTSSLMGFATHSSRLLVTLVWLRDGTVDCVTQPSALQCRLQHTLSSLYVVAAVLACILLVVLIAAWVAVRRGAERDPLERAGKPRH